MEARIIAADDWGMIAIRLGVATVLGLLIGFEREWRGRDAGLRTHALVALSSAMITISGLLIARQSMTDGHEGDPLRVIQGLAQAIGFIAGGLIFVRGGDVRNMTTAATLWMAAGIGIAAGAGQFPLVLIASGIAIFVLFGLTLLKRCVPARRHEEEEAELQELRMPNRRGSIE
jgi:putative Mg2+ transporter-C (MgtC) family protein